MHFGRKHVETGLGCLHKLATLLKYHMPLSMKKKKICSLGIVSKLIRTIRSMRTRTLEGPNNEYKTEIITKNSGPICQTLKVSSH